MAMAEERPPGMADGVQRGGDQIGTGMVGTVIGVAMLLLLLLFAVQVLFGLYAKSVVTAVTYDAAKNVAGADLGDTPVRRAEAEEEAKRQLGRLGRQTTFDWAGSDSDNVRLTVRAERPSILPGALLDTAGLGHIERTVLVRVERVR
jgi:hypothetical protein